MAVVEKPPWGRRLECGVNPGAPVGGTYGPADWMWNGVEWVMWFVWKDGEEEDGWSGPEDGEDVRMDFHLDVCLIRFGRSDTGFCPFGPDEEEDRVDFSVGPVGFGALFLNVEGSVGLRSEKVGFGLEVSKLCFLTRGEKKSWELARFSNKG